MNHPVLYELSGNGWSRLRIVGWLRVLGHRLRAECNLMASDDRARADWWCGQVEAELTRIGGGELLADARAEAQTYVALFFPWDGVGEEPLDRVHARLEILVQRLDRAGGARGKLA